MENFSADATHTHQAKTLCITTARHIATHTDHGPRDLHTVEDADMDLTERIQQLLSKARHPSTINNRLEIRQEIQRLQQLRSQAEADTVRPTNPKT